MSHDGGSSQTEPPLDGVVIPLAAVEALCEHKKRQLAERLQAGSEWADTELMFTN